MSVVLREYQQKALSQLTTSGVNVLSICPGGGKTITATEFALNPYFKKVLILAHGTNVLKQQWSEEFKSRGISFSHNVKSDDKFIIALPQTLNKMRTLPKFDLVIVDEAHEFYFADTVEWIIKMTKPKCQLLLTGTPSKLIARGFSPIIIPGVQVYREGYLSDPYISCVSSAHSLNEEQFDSARGEVKDEVKENKKLVKASFTLLIKEMLTRLNMAGVIKNKPNLMGALSSTGLGEVSKMMFQKLDKTMISARDVKQAHMILDILKKYKVKAVVSVSEDDEDSSEIQAFKQDPKINVLIVVRRGILGFNMPELVNVVDFTGSRNIDRIYQLYARALRKHGTTDKFFFKLCYGLNKDVDALYLQAALCLNNPDFISKFNGKNLKGMEVIVFKDDVKPKEDSQDEKEESNKEDTDVSNPINRMNKSLAFQVLRLGLLSELTINNQNPYWSEYKYEKFGRIIAKLTDQVFEPTIGNVTEEQLLKILELGVVPEDVYED